MPGIIYFFQLPYIQLFILSLLFLAAALMLFRRDQDTAALTMLFLCALSVRLFMAQQDTYLNLWDERYHALVARNLLEHPLHPTLRDMPVCGYLSTGWTESYTWLHKQPLFLWQMMLSIKLFGATELAVRYPSILMGALMVLMVFGIARTLTSDKRIAIAASLLYCFCRYHLEQVSGSEGMDHNDVAFHFYILASTWAFVRYSQKKTWASALIIGICAGAAVLNKWLTGLVVFAGWGVSLLFALTDKDNRREWQHLLLALLVCSVVFLPWQLYIMYRFPEEAAREYAYNARHITEVLEGHTGTIFFYVGQLPAYFGELGWLFVPAGVIIAFMQLRKGRIARQTGIVLLTMFIALFVFFSYIVMTKVWSYFFVAAPIAVIFMAVALAEIHRQLLLRNWIRTGNTIYVILLVATLASMFNPIDIKARHDPNNEERMGLAKRTLIYRNLQTMLPPDIKLIINANGLEDISAMFYNSGLSIYAGVPSLRPGVYDSLAKAGVRFAAFPSRPSYELPDTIKTNPSLYVLPVSIP